MLNRLKLPGSAEEAARSQSSEDSVRKLGIMAVMIMI